MKLTPLDHSDILRAADWLACRENCQWLDFGHGQRSLSAPVLALMNKRELHLLRMYTSDEADTPVGLVALSDISPIHRTATL